MRCCTMRLSFVNLWVVIYGLGIAWHGQPLVVFPAVFAALVAHGVYCWTLPLAAHSFTGGARAIHRLIVGGTFAIALVGLASASTGVSYTAAGEHLRDAPLAVFFLVIAILAWRALVDPRPRRTSAIALVIYTAWLPLVVWNALSNIGSAPRRPDWHDVATYGALWILVAAGGIVCWLVTLATAGDDVPRARVR